MSISNNSDKILYMQKYMTYITHKNSLNIYFKHFTHLFIVKNRYKYLLDLCKKCRIVNT